MNNRRKLIIALGGLSVGLAHAQPAERAGKTMRVGYLGAGTRANFEAGNGKIIFDAMREMGWIEAPDRG